MDRPLSKTDLQTLCRARILLYSDLAAVSHIDEILEPYGCCILLIVLKNMPHNIYGHWCCVLRRGNTLEWFDPYGLTVDNEFNDFSKQKRFETGQTQNWLSRLFYESPYNLEYNSFRLQKRSDKVSTCGRWCAVRVWCKNLSIEAFRKLKLTDKKVTTMTQKVLEAMRRRHSSFY